MTMGYRLCLAPEPLHQIPSGPILLPLDSVCGPIVKSSHQKFYPQNWSVRAVIRFLLAQMPEFCMALDTVQYSIRTIITELYRYHSFCSSDPNGMVFICSLCLWIRTMSFTQWCHKRKWRKQNFHIICKVNCAVIMFIVYCVWMSM